MSHVRVSVTLPVPVAQAWDDLADISSHVEWMADAESITFTSASTSGVGTAFDSVTKVGPIRLTDRMEITEWAPGLAMGVRHVGIVTGSGRFTLDELGPAATRFTWDETLALPWWLGGPVASVVLRVIWRRNLRRFRRRFED